MSNYISIVCMNVFPQNAGVRCASLLLIHRIKFSKPSERLYLGKWISHLNQTTYVVDPIMLIRQGLEQIANVI